MEIIEKAKLQKQNKRFKREERKSRFLYRKSQRICQKYNHYVHKSVPDRVDTKKNPFCVEKQCKDKDYLRQLHCNEQCLVSSPKNERIDFTENKGKYKTFYTYTSINKNRYIWKELIPKVRFDDEDTNHMGKDWKDIDLSNQSGILSISDMFELLNNNKINKSVVKKSNKNNNRRNNPYRKNWVQWNSDISYPLECREQCFRDKKPIIQYETKLRRQMHSKPPKYNYFISFPTRIYIGKTKIHSRTPRQDNRTRITTLKLNNDTNSNKSNSSNV